VIFIVRTPDSPPLFRVTGLLHPAVIGFTNDVLIFGSYLITLINKNRLNKYNTIFLNKKFFFRIIIQNLFPYSVNLVDKKQMEL
jgi:hypothetical protein